MRGSSVALYMFIQSMAGGFECDKNILPVSEPGRFERNAQMHILENEVVSAQ